MTLLLSCAHANTDATLLQLGFAREKRSGFPDPASVRPNAGSADPSQVIASGDGSEPRRATLTSKADVCRLFACSRVCDDSG